MRRIEKLMKEKGITQTALALKTGVQRPSINRVLNGKECPWPKWREKFARALDWPLDKADELFEEE